jgi:hypothetical protein
MSPTLKADALAAALTVGPVVVGVAAADTTRAATEGLGTLPSLLAGLLALIAATAVTFDGLRTQYMPMLALLEAEARAERSDQ